MHCVNRSHWVPCAPVPLKENKRNRNRKWMGNPSVPFCQRQVCPCSFRRRRPLRLCCAECEGPLRGRFERCWEDRSGDRSEGHLGVAWGSLCYCAFMLSSHISRFGKGHFSYLLFLFFPIFIFLLAPFQEGASCARNGAQLWLIATWLSAPRVDVSPPPMLLNAAESPDRICRRPATSTNTPTLSLFLSWPCALSPCLSLARPSFLPGVGPPWSRCPPLPRTFPLHTSPYLSRCFVSLALSYVCLGTSFPLLASSMACTAACCRR